MADIDRIKRNIGRMIDGGAAEDEIDTYLASEGVGLDQLRASAAPKTEPSTVADVAKSGGAGLVKGAAGLAGLPSDASGLIGQGINWVGKQLGFKDVSPQMAASNRGYGAQDVQSGIEQLTGPLYKPQTTAGEYAQTVGEFAPAALAGPGGIVRRAVTQAVVPGLVSEAAGQATKGSELEPWARLGGALAGPLALNAAARAVTPFPARAPGRQAMVNTLEQEGIVPTAGQRSGNKALQYAESTLGDYPLAGNAATRAAENQQGAFTSAALRRIGQTTEPTPANVNQAVQNIQNEFQRLSTSNVLRYDNQFATDLTQTLQRYMRKLPNQQREVIQDFLVDFSTFPGRMPGEVYQIARSDLSRMAHAARNTDPTYSDALRGLRNALDDAMRRSISPADRAAWDTARARWGSWRTIERAAKETDAAGNVKITPAALKQAVASRDPGGFARGQGDFNELARAGSEILRPLPQSGTTPRLVATGLLGALTGASGGVLPALAALGAPPLLGRALMSRPVQGYLGNQLAGRTRLSTGLPAGLLALLDQQRGLVAQ